MVRFLQSVPEQRATFDLVAYIHEALAGYCETCGTRLREQQAFGRYDAATNHLARFILLHQADHLGKECPSQSTVSIMFAGSRTRAR